MKVSVYSWAGVGTKDFDGTIRFFTEAIGLSLARRKDDSQHALFRLPSGQDFEVFGFRSRWHPLQTHLVLGFETIDLQTVRRDMEVRGVEFISDLVEASGWGMFCYFRGPDNYLYELVQRCPVKTPPSIRAILGYSWVGLRTTDYTKTVQFFAELITSPLESHDNVNQRTMFRLPSGQLFEIFGPEKTKPEYQYMQGPCIGFDVKNVKAVYQDMLSRGVNFITEIEQAPNGNSWVYFLGPDDQLYAIRQRVN